jgi:hypothetical protein
LDNKTIREALTALCNADGHYTWTRDGTTINVYPKETVGDGSYLMNRRLPRLELKDAPTAQDAMFGAVAQLPPPFEQIAFAQAGGNTRFPMPLRARFENLTLRQALNLIARNIAPRAGWVLSGSRASLERSAFTTGRYRKNRLIRSRRASPFDVLMFSPAGSRAVQNIRRARETRV